MDQIRLSELLSNPPKIPENQLMTSPFVNIESLKTLDVQQTKPFGSENNTLFYGRWPIKSPSADQNLRSAKIWKSGSKVFWKIVFYLFWDFIFKFIGKLKIKSKKK